MRVLHVPLILSLTTALCVFVFAGFAYPQTLKICRSGNLRSGPSTSNEIVGKVAIGMDVEQIEKAGDWYKVQLPDSQSGWIHAILLSPPQTSGAGNDKQSLRSTELDFNLTGLGYAVWSDQKGQKHFRSVGFDSLYCDGNAIAVESTKITNNEIQTTNYGNIRVTIDVGSYGPTIRFYPTPAQEKKLLGLREAAPAQPDTLQK